MPLTNGQKKAIHSAARQAGITDDQYRWVLENVGGFNSSAHPHFSRESFIACMAAFEKHAGGKLRGCTAGYWQGQDGQYNPLDPLRHRARTIAESIGMNGDELAAFIAGTHFSSGRYNSLGELPAVWLNKLIEALKGVYETRMQGA